MSAPVTRLVAVVERAQDPLTIPPRPAGRPVRVVAVSREALTPADIACLILNAAVCLTLGATAGHAMSAVACWIGVAP